MLRTGGRGAAAAIGTRLRAPTLLVLALLGSLAGAVLLLVGVGSLPLSLLAVLIMGFSFGPIFPTMLALVTLRFRQGTGTAASVIVGMGSTGGALIGALLVGLMANYTGFLVPKVALFSNIALMVAILLWRPQGVYPVTSR